MNVYAISDYCEIQIYSYFIANEFHNLTKLQIDKLYANFRRFCFILVLLKKIYEFNFPIKKKL